MRRRSIAALAAFVGIGLAACETPTQPADSGQDVSAAVVDGALTWADMAGVDIPLATEATIPAVRTVFAEEGVEMVAGPSLDQLTGFEDFEGSNVSGITSCAGPFNVHTNDACYSPEEILEGFSIDNLNAANDPFGMVVITAPNFGFSSTVVGPNFFVDDTEMTFGYGGVNEVWFDLFEPVRGPCYLNLYVYDAGGLVAHFIIWTGSGATPASYGVIAGFPLTKFEFVQSDICGELFDNVMLVKYAN